MNKQTEALKLALESLKGWRKGFPDHWGDIDEYSVDAIREALAEESSGTEQQAILECRVQARPLSHSLNDYHIAMSEGPLHFTWTDKPHRLVYDLIAAVKYYAAPQPAQPQQEPVAWVKVTEHWLSAIPRLEIAKPNEDGAKPVYMQPPVNTNAGKPWVELTADEMVELAKKYRDMPVALIATTEAKLKEKNA